MYIDNKEKYIKINKDIMLVYTRSIVRNNVFYKFGIKLNDVMYNRNGFYLKLTYNVQ